MGGGRSDSFIYVDLKSVKSNVLIERNVITRDAAPTSAKRLLNSKDIIYQTVRPYQRNNLFFNIEDGKEYVASTGYAQLRAYDCPEFLFQLIHTDAFVNCVLQKCTGSTYPVINSTVLASIKIATPRKSEKMKIAECLCSLDDLIVAEGQKIESLRKQKHGLLQQMFPQSNKSAPKLRFQEFLCDSYQRRHVQAKQKDMERVKHPPKNHDEFPFAMLGEVCDLRKGTTITKKETITGNVPVVAGGVKPAYFHDTPNRQANIVTISASGASAGHVNFFDVPIWASDCVTVLPIINTLIIQYMYFYLLSIQHYIYNELAQGSAQPHVYARDLEQLLIPIPSSNEQSRIVNGFLSLDNLIAQEERKLEMLMKHKQGLLKQIFPSPEIDLCATP